MELTKEKMEQLAQLYCFELTEQEKEELTLHFEGLLHDLEILSHIDTTGVELMVTPFDDITTYLRQDCIQDELSIEAVFENAPEREGDYFVVPKVVE